MATVVTAFEVFNAADPNRPVVTVIRQGGGTYLAVSASSKDEYPDYVTALAAAETLGTGKTADDVAGTIFKDQRIADLEAKVAALEAELAKKG